MEAKEKAIELHDKYYKVFEDLGFDTLPNKYAKQCALLCVDEILNVIKTTLSLLATEPSLRAGHMVIYNGSDYKILLDEDYTEVSPEYWEQVKKEIKKL